MSRFKKRKDLTISLFAKKRWLGAQLKTFVHSHQEVRNLQLHAPSVRLRTCAVRQLWARCSTTGASASIVREFGLYPPYRDKMTNDKSKPAKRKTIAFRKENIVPRRYQLLHIIVFNYGNSADRILLTASSSSFRSSSVSVLNSLRTYLTITVSVSSRTLCPETSFTSQSATEFRSSFVN